MTQNNYLYSNQHVQGNNIALKTNSWLRIISLANAKLLIKIHFCNKNFICCPGWKILGGPFTANLDLAADKKIFSCPTKDRHSLQNPLQYLKIYTLVWNHWLSSYIFRCEWSQGEICNNYVFCQENVSTYHFR